MKKTIAIVVGVGALFLAIFVFERYCLTRWYDFKIGNIEIEVMSDECETCFLDWPIDHTIWIESEDGLSGKFRLYAEGPRLEFGFNADYSSLVINCPGFSNLFIDLKRMQQIDVLDEQSGMKLEGYQIKWIVNKNKQLMKLDTLRSPNKNWEGR